MIHHPPETTHISCVIPTLNSAGTLETALLSLRMQRQVPVNIIVADSGSTDETLSICQRHSIPVIYVPPGNMYRAINAGLRQCTTEWLAYLNSDDWLYPDAYARLMASGEKLPADVVYGNCDFVDDAGRFVYSMAAAKAHQTLPLFRQAVMGFQPHAAIFRRRLYEQINGFDEQYRYSADADFFIRLLHSNAKFANCGGAPVACFRVHGNQLTHTRATAMNAERARIFGGGKMQPMWRDYLMLMQWRARNLPHYALRVMRASLLAARLIAPGSMEMWDENSEK